MKFIDWSKRNYLIIILIIIVVLILAVKINIYIKDNKTSNLTPTMVETEPENKIDNLISPTPTIISKTTYGNKTKEEILHMEIEERDEFITNLNREEVEKLGVMPNYDFSEFLPYETNNFIVEKFDYQSKKLTVKPLITDNNQIKKEVDEWLFYETGNNPNKIIINFTEMETGDILWTEDVDINLPDKLIN